MCTNKSPDILVSGRWDEVRSSTKRKALSVTLYASSATVGGQVTGFVKQKKNLLRDV